MSRRELPPVRDASHEASIVIALEAAGIESVVRQRTFDSNGIPTYSHIFVESAEYDRALAAIADLQATPLVTPASGYARTVRIGFAVIVLAIFTLVAYSLVKPT
jgi:hypothetical protein